MLICFQQALSNTDVNFLLVIEKSVYWWVEMELEFLICLFEYHIEKVDLRLNNPQKLVHVVRISQEHLKQ